MITEAKNAVMRFLTDINSVTNISRIIINSLNLHDYAFVVSLKPGILKDIL